MRRFIVNALGFAGLTGALIGGVCAWEIVAEIRAYRREVIPPAGADILLTSDSQMAKSVDPELAPRFFNFCANGRQLDQAYMVADDVIRAANGKIKSVGIDVSPQILVAPLDTPISKMEYAARYWLLHVLHWKDLNIRDLRGVIKVARDNLTGRRWRHAWRAVRGRVIFRSSLHGEYAPLPDCTKEENPGFYRGLLNDKVRRSVAVGRMTGDEAAFDLLAKMIADFQERKLAVFVVTTPWNPDLLASFRSGELEHFTKLMQTFCRRNHVPYLDFLRTPFPEEEWIDSNHLNVRGAKRFTPMLLRAVEEAGL